MYFNVDEITARISKAWMSHINLGQDQIAKDMGISSYTLRKFIQKKSKPKIKTQMKILAWLNKMESIEEMNNGTM